MGARGKTERVITVDKMILLRSRATKAGENSERQRAVSVKGLYSEI